MGGTRPRCLNSGLGAGCGFGNLSVIGSTMGGRDGIAKGDGTVLMVIGGTSLGDWGAGIVFKSTLIS